jgi:hypothetical protein
MKRSLKKASPEKVVQVPLLVQNLTRKLAPVSLIAGPGLFDINYEEMQKWLDIFRRVEEGESVLLESLWHDGAWGRQQNCLVKVSCRFDFYLRKFAGENRNKFGMTAYSHIETQRGHTRDDQGEIDGCFTHIIIVIICQINMLKIGVRWEEENNVVLRERRNANQTFAFEKVPVEFIKMHEEEHAKDICATLRPIVARAGNLCEFNVANVDKEVTEAWNAMTIDVDVQSETEERIRRRVWERWDRR